MRVAAAPVILGLGLGSAARTSRSAQGISSAPGVQGGRSRFCFRPAAARLEESLLGRIRASPLLADLEQAIREDSELSGNANEADCVAYDWDHPDTPENGANYRQLLDRKHEQLRRIEAVFERLTAGCPAG